MAKDRQKKAKKAPGVNRKPKRIIKHRQPDDLPEIPLQCYRLWEGAQEIRPGSPQRAWMDDFPDRHPYRCLPLATANNTGWEIVSPTSFVIRWNGGMKTEDISFECEDDYPHFERFAASHFSRGVVTFHVDYIFRTPPGWHLWVGGPPNVVREGVFALNGIVETDWLPYSFTMNYILTRPGEVRFKKGEAYCFIFPVRANDAARMQPEILDIAQNPELAERHGLWAGARAQHQEKIAGGDKEAAGKAWQRFYFHGKGPDGWRPDVAHTHKRRMKAPLSAVPEKISGSGSNDAVDALAGAFHEIDKMRAGMQACPVHAQSGGAEAAGGEAASSAGKSGGAVEIAINRPDCPPREASGPEGGETHFSNYREVVSQEEDAGFYMEADFLSAAQCDAVIDAYRRNEERAERSITQDDYFSGRFMWINSLPEKEVYIKRLMNDVRARAAQRLMAFYKLDAPVYSDTIQIVKWPEGYEMPAHADKMHPDGAPHNTPFRDFTSLVYLNDDFEGGEFYFEKLKLRLKPKKGLLVCFTGGMEHFHGVGKIISGERFTMPSWYSKDIRHLDVSYRDIF